MQQVRASGKRSYTVEDVLRSQTAAKGFGGTSMAKVYSNKTLATDVALEFYWQHRPQREHLSHVQSTALS